MFSDAVNGLFTSVVSVKTGGKWAYMTSVNDRLAFVYVCGYSSHFRNMEIKCWGFKAGQASGKAEISTTKAAERQSAAFSHKTRREQRR